MTKQTRKVLTAILMAVFLLSVFMLLRQQADNSAGSDVYESALQMAISETQPEEMPTEATEVPETTAPPVPEWIPAPLEEEDPNIATLEAIDLKALREKNPDVLGWILIPDTKVNYPLMQGTDNGYYLEHTWDGASNSIGSIFLETRNSPDMTDFNTIIYGHNMANGAMFGNLRKYFNTEFWTKHPYVYILNDQGIYRYDIFSAYQAQVDSSTYGLSFNQVETRINFLEMARENSQIITDVDPAVTDRIITLSTCSGAGYSTRWVVHARLKMIQEES